MPMPDQAKLEKLTIIGYADRKRTRKRGSVDAMFNPQSVSRSYAIGYVRSRGIKNFQRVAEFSGLAPDSLSISLLFDGSEVAERLAGGQSRGVPVSDRVRAFCDLCYEIDSQTHEPAYLVVQWGALAYPCRLAELTIAYTSFNRDGTPLRAELSVRFAADEDPAKTAMKYNMASPDVAHGRIATAADTLPLLCHEVYGTTDHCVRVARFNGLDTLRRLEPGRLLTLPPLGQREARR